MEWRRKLGNWASRVFLPSSPKGIRARFERGFEEAARLYSGGRYDDSELQLRKALQVAGEFGSDSLERARCLEKVGDFYHSVGTYAKAEDLIKQSLAIRERLFGLAAPELVGALNDLALLHYAQGKYPEGEVLYRRLLPLLEAERGPVDREVAICLDNFAAMLRKQKRDDEAAQLQKRAREIRKKLAPANSVS